MDRPKLLLIVGECRADGFPEDLPLVAAERSARINCGFAAVIAGKNAELEIGSALGVIVDETFEGKLPRGIQLITCGISPKNTVSATSRTAEKLTLSLNRGIRTLTGKLCEPLEQPVDVPESADEYGVMAAFAARLLLEL